MTTILKGNIVSAPACGRLDVTEHGYLIAENGVITGEDGLFASNHTDRSLTSYSPRLAR